MTREEKMELIWKYNGILKVLFYVSIAGIVASYIMASYFAYKSSSDAIVLSLLALILSLSVALGVMGKVIIMAAETMQLMLEEIEELEER